MTADIVPGLLEEILGTYETTLAESKTAQNVEKKIVEGHATYADANEYAIENGKSVADAFAKHLSSSTLPDGRMYFNIANRVISPVLEKAFTSVVERAVGVQTGLNKMAGIGLKGIRPELNQDRIDGLINKVSNAEIFDDVAWVLDEPVINFNQSIIDDTIESNVEFQGKSGLSPTITRTCVGGCCDWCRDIAGVYSYPNVPQDVYRRHRYCRCTCEYDPGDGSKKRQDVWSKQSLTDTEEIEARKKIGKGDTNKELDTIAGVKKGKPMTFEEADEMRANPLLYTDPDYQINCQTCVVAHEARLRGFDVSATPSTPGSVNRTLAKETHLAWRDRKTGETLDYIYEYKTYTPKQYKKYLESVIEQDARYTMQFTWKGQGYSGHIISVDRLPDGQIRLFDPQIGRQYLGQEVDSYLTQFKYSTKIQGFTFELPPKLMRVDNADFDETLVHQILTKRPET